MAKTTLQGNANCSTPKTVTGLTKMANEIYLPYLQHCGRLKCECSCTVGVRVAQSKGWQTKNEAYLSTRGSSQSASSHSLVTG